MRAANPSTESNADVPERGRRWKFAGIVFDEKTLELTVAGITADIERKPLEVLRFLLQHAGEVVTKDEILATVWPGRVLSDTVLSKSIARLRDVLGEDGQSAIKTVHGYGYRLVAPVTAEFTRTAPVAHFGFSAGEHPPHRPLWSLVERLGSGAHGEAWLVRHDKTREQRVYKFALNESSLASLKREITLFRLLQESVGDKARIVKLRDWNLEQIPYFIEFDHVVDGSLVDWCTRKGGADSISLEVRIELVARVADALATIHAVGVLHKDIKPSNILIESDREACPDVLMGDLGSGGLLDHARIVGLGITRMGFTQTLSAVGGAGSPLYIAPELMQGQPPTVQSDIYALGVLCYQLVVGDLHRPLTAGWEREIDDDVLRGDIAAAAEGVAAHRLDSAAELARRLRSLQERRHQRDAERQRQVEIEKAQRAAERATARRTATRVAFATLVVGLVTSIGLYFDARSARALAEQDRATAEHERAVAEKERATAQAVADFLSRDMLSQVSEKPLRYLTVPELLSAASERLSGRIESPAAAAKIHAALGFAFGDMSDFPSAHLQLEKALDYYERIPLDDVTPALVTASYAVLFASAMGQLDQKSGRYEAFRALGVERLGATHPAVLQYEISAGRAQTSAGHWQEAAQRLDGIIQKAEQANPRSTAVVVSAQAALADALIRLERRDEAKEVLRKARDELAKTGGGEGVDMAFVLGRLGLAEAESGQPELARSDIQEAIRIARQRTHSDESALFASIEFYQGMAYIHAGRLNEGIQILRRTLERAEALSWKRDQTGEVRIQLGRALLASGETNRAVDQLRQAVKSCDAAFGHAHPLAQVARTWYADALSRSKRDSPEAREIMESIDKAALQKLGPVHSIFRDVERVQAQLRRQGNPGATAH